MIEKDFTSLEEGKSFDYWKLGVLALFSIYFLDIAFRYENNWCFIDGVNIWMHEAGHFLFMFTGSDFITILGGTILQILVPIVFVLYFYANDQRFSAALTTFWLGESIVNVSVYMADAVVMQLPLIGGGGTEGHDWHNMFLILDILPMTSTLSTITRMLGSLIIMFAIVWGINESRKGGSLADSDRTIYY